MPHADIIALTNMRPCVSYNQPMEPNGNVPPEARLLVLSYAHSPSARAGTTSTLHAHCMLHTCPQVHPTKSILRLPCRGLVARDRISVPNVCEAIVEMCTCSAPMSVSRIATNITYSHHCWGLGVLTMVPLANVSIHAVIPIDDLRLSPY